MSRELLDLVTEQADDEIMFPPERWTATFPVLQSCILEHGDREFYCTHRPEGIPDDWDGWAIHGHIHNNDTETYPFVAVDARRVNVSSELLNYRPLALDTLTVFLMPVETGYDFVMSTAPEKSWGNGTTNLLLTIGEH